MSKKIKITIWLLAVILVTVVFYSTSIGKAAGSFINDWSLKLTRVERQVMYSAQMLSPTNRFFDVVLKVPFHKQEHALSCEVAALKMALGFYGITVAERDLIRGLKFDTRDSRNEYNIWGDPEKGFVGDIDGKIPNEGYGVYEQPLVDLALQYREAKKMKEPRLVDVLNEVNNGHPVIVWGSVSDAKDISWFTPEGKYIKAVYGEHTRVVIGFGGTPENTKYILLMDPVYGKVIMSKNRFLKDWALLDNKAVVVY